MGVFYDEYHLPTLGRNLNNIKVEGGEDWKRNSSKHIKTYKSSWMHTGSKSSDVEIESSPNWLLNHGYYFK